MDDNARFACIWLLTCAGGVAVLIWAISFGVRSGLKRRERETHSPEQHRNRAQPIRGFPVQPMARFFVVDGVAKDTAADTTVQIEAASPENAKVKAELQGIVVTDVREIQG